MNNEFINRFTERLDPQPIRDLARSTGFSQRQGTIDPFDFVVSLSAGQASALRMTYTSQASVLTQPVSRQAVHQRYTAQAVAFCQASFQHVLADSLDHRPEQPQAALLRQHFAAVHLLDTTCFDAPPSLQTLFPSCGGDGSAANVKVLLRYDYLSGQLEPLRLLPGKQADQGLAAQAAQLLKQDELQLSDKGFYDGAAWRSAQARGASLLMPWTRSVSVTRPATAEQAEERVDVAQELRASTASVVEWPEVALGQAERRIGPVRLVAFRLSEESANRQRQGLRKKLRCQGKTPTAEALELAGWLILVTNASAAKLPTAVLAYVYRVRWQVELIFRQCKDTLRLDQSRGDNKYRTQCEIWARLLAAVLIFGWHTHANAHCWQQQRREISFEKVARIFQQWGLTLARALIRRGQELRELLADLWSRILVLARKERTQKRATTWENLWHHWLAPRSIGGLGLRGH